MKKSLLIIAVAIATLGFTSCKKDNKEPNQPTTPLQTEEGVRIKVTLVEDNSNRFTYDYGQLMGYASVWGFQETFNYDAEPDIVFLQQEGGCYLDTLMPYTDKDYTRSITVNLYIGGGQSTSFSANELNGDRALFEVYNDGELIHQEIGQTFNYYIEI